MFLLFWNSILSQPQKLTTPDKIPCISLNYRITCFTRSDLLKQFSPCLGVSLFSAVLASQLTFVASGLGLTAHTKSSVFFTTSENDVSPPR